MFQNPSKIAPAILLTVFLAQSATADFVRRFSTVNSLAGARGDAAVVHHGLVHSKNRAHYYMSAVFRDPHLPGEIIAIATTGDQTFDPVTGNEVEAADTHEIVIGRSVGGEVFTWERMLKTRGGLRVAGLRATPDPSRTGVWVGIASLWQNRPDDPREIPLGLTDIEIDYARKVFRFPESPSTWREYPFGADQPFHAPGQPDPEIPYISYSRFGLRYNFTSITPVTLDGQERLELWGSRLDDQPTARDLSTCADPVAYAANLSAWAPGGNRGTVLHWSEFRLGGAIGQRIVDGKDVVSDVRSLPTDHVRSDMQPMRAQMTLGGQVQDFVYVGTQDPVVCQQEVGRATSGAGIRYIELTWDDHVKTYRETQIRDALDIGNPGNPGWTCEDPTAVCKGNQWRYYSFVSALPVQASGRLQLYVNNWAGALPTLPVIGQVGTVAVGTAPITVDLGRTYDDPVVFVQPPSWEGGEPVIARVTSVGASSFTVKLQEGPNQGPGHPAETLSYVVLERGTYRLGDRRVLEVDRVQTHRTVPASTTWTSKLDLTDGALLSTGAVAFTQLQGNADPSYAKTRHFGPPTLGPCDPADGCAEGSRVAEVRFGIEKDEASLRAGVSHGGESVGVLLVAETWLGRQSSVFKLGPWGAGGFTVGRAPSVPGVANGGWTQIHFERPWPPEGALHPLNDPVLLAWPETRNGGDPVELRYFRQGSTDSLTPEGVQLATDEDLSFDPERNHSGESVAYWVIGRDATPTGHLLRGQPVDPLADFLRPAEGAPTCQGPSTEGLLGTWDFENPFDLGEDSSGAGRHGVPMGSVASTSGRVRPDGSAGRALLLRGDGYLKVPSLGHSFSGRSALTVEAWVWVDSHRRTNVFRSQQPVALHSDRFAVSNYAQGGGWASADASPPTGTWYHLVGVFEGGGQRIYVDGQLKANRLNAFSALQGATYVDWAIGARIPGASGPDQHFSGRIDVVRVYDRALSAGEIQSAAADCVP